MSAAAAILPSVNSFWRSLQVQGRVVAALMLREVITRYGRKGLGVLWLFLEPMLFTATLTAVWYAVRLHELSTLPIIVFSVTGWVSFLMWRSAASRCLGAIGSNQSLLYHRNVKAMDFFVARIMLEVIGATLALVVLLGLLALVEWVALPLDWLTVTLAWLFFVWFAFNLGFMVGALGHLFETFSKIWRILSIVLMLMSGKFFMVHWLPEAGQNIVLWLPMVHALEMLRFGYWGDIIPPYYSIQYMLVSNLVLTLFGLSLLRIAARKADDT